MVAFLLPFLLQIGITMGQLCSPSRLPPAAMSGNSASLSSTDACTQGTYELSSSFSTNTYLALDMNNSSAWSSSPNYTFSGAYNGSTSTLISGQNKTGDWIQIKFPYRIQPNSYHLQSLSAQFVRNPKSWTLVGSNDGQSWTLLDEFNATNWVTVDYQTLTQAIGITSLSSYSYFRLIISSADFFFIPGDWTISLHSGSYYAVRITVSGDIECLSTNATTCLVSSTYSGTLAFVNSTDPAKISPVTCGANNSHFAAFGNDGYSVNGHWCQVFRNTLDTRQVSISEFYLKGDLSTFIFLSSLAANFVRYLVLSADRHDPVEYKYK